LSPSRPARYFPVKPTPFRLQAGLLPFGTDFGNGRTDREFFQLDEQRERYLRAKGAVDPSRHAVLCRDDGERRTHATVVPWIRRTLAAEHPEVARGVAEEYRALSLAVQEDLVVLHRGAGGDDAAILVDVSFPSDWRPDRIAGTDFRFIHGPVPGFADAAAQAASMVTAMIERGPYVRFVWTLAADDFLDHHPEQGRRRAWSEATEGFLRVERQVTVPFAEAQASLFLIRTYLYPFSDLTGEEREVLRRSLATMPPEAARYKSFTAAMPDILRLL
jgi:hypothetical protein